MSGISSFFFQMSFKILFVCSFTDVYFLRLPDLSGIAEIHLCNLNIFVVSMEISAVPVLTIRVCVCTLFYYIKSGGSFTQSASGSSSEGAYA